MSDMEPPQAGNDVHRLNTLNNWGLVSYILHLLVALAAVVPGLQVGVGLLLVALVIDWVKQPDAQGTWHASHFRWRWVSLLVAGGLYVVTSPLFLLLYVPGMVAWWLISVWFLYRIIKGLVYMHSARSLEV